MDASLTVDPSSEGYVRTQSGFSLMELMITVAVAGILAAVAVPSLNGFVRNTRLTNTSSLLASDLNLARGEAVKRNARMIVCARKKTSSTKCKPNADEDVTWANGWVICYDMDADDDCDDATTALPNPILLRSAISSQLSLTATTNFLRFNGAGAQSGANPATFQFNLSGTWSGAPAKTISVDRNGSIRNS